MDGDGKPDLAHAAVRVRIKSARSRHGDTAAAGLAKFSAIAHAGTPADFKRFLVDQMHKWGAIVKLAGARID